MTTDPQQPPEPETSCIEDILRQQAQLEQRLRDEFKKELTVLFTDICGYTAYMESRGDLAGRSMLQKHNDMLLPVIEEHGGHVIKTIGDAIMATFETPMGAVQAAVVIQEVLTAYNRKARASDQIRVKIGINCGEALVDDKDVFGDAVNVAARVQAKAEAEEILISQNLYDVVCGSDDVLCRFHDTAELKGKAKPMNLYRVVWKDEPVDFADHQTRAEGKQAAPEAARPPVFHLELAREAGHIKICTYEEAVGDTSTVRHYEEIDVSMEKINARCREIVDLLNQANRLGRVTKETLLKLRSMGQVLTDEFFTPKVKEKLAATTAEHLIVNLDDQLVQVPWELFHDGRRFLCQRFSMGRLVRTRQDISPGRSRQLGRPLRMLVLADPRGDLKGAYEEGQQIVAATDGYEGQVNASLKTEGITSDYVRSKLRNFDLVHYAGHSDYDPENAADSGWRLSEETLSARDIQKMGGTAAMPALIFSNACQSARTEAWGVNPNFQDEIFGLANAFLLSGVKHYVGTFWEILDEPSRHFAQSFYQHLFSGVTVGEAMRQAREELIRAYGEETIVWGSYVLYGDPTFNYMAQLKARAAEPAEDKAPHPSPGGELRAREEVLSFGGQAQRSRRPLVWAGLALLFLLVVAGLWYYPAHVQRQIDRLEAEARNHYVAGRFEDALKVCDALLEKDSDLRLPYVLRGDIALRNGNVDAAREAYRQATEAGEGPPSLSARALVGLGRIASMQGDAQQALKWYQQAAAADGGSRAGVTSQALLLERTGDYQQALALLDQAQASDDGDGPLAALAAETRRRVELSKDEERQQQIDTLVGELIAKSKEPQRAVAWDGWTSRPLSVWVMDFESDGFSLQEGENRLLTAGITEQLVDQSPAQVVERALLDKLLTELKLGSSDLADRNTALAVGRLMAARLILSGKVVHAGPQTEVAVRLFETETGRIAVAHSDTFPAAARPGEMAEALSQVLIRKLVAAYPLRGKIARVEGDDVFIDIGSAVGVKPGMTFKLARVQSTLEVISAGPDRSLTQVADGEKELFEGLRVEQVR